MKITGWTHWDDPNFEEFPWMQEKIEAAHLDYDLARSLVVSEIRNRRYKFSGFYHQGGSYGVPVIDNHYWMGFSFRQWGQVIEDAYQEHPGDRMAYVVWAWFPPEEEKFPDPSDYDAQCPENGTPNQ